jgi:hypothetical protein
MRILRKAVVLGFAGLGVYKAWELVNANLDIAKDKANRVRGKLEPAIVEAEGNLKAAVDTVAEAVNDAATEAGITSDDREAAGTIHSASRTA